MQKVLLILGAVMVAAGLLIASGMMKYEDKDKIADFGSLELEASREKDAPPNWGYVLLGAGAIAVVVGLVSKRP